MERLIEILRRLILVGVWIVAIGSAAMFTVLAFSESEFAILLISIGILFAAWIATKIINWIFIG